MKRNLILVFIMLLGMTIILFTSLEGGQSLAASAPLPQKGAVDLSHWDFDKQGSVSLAGEWEFYFNRYLTKEDFDAGRAGKPTYIQVPSSRSNMKKVKPFEDNKFYGTLRLKVTLPDADQIYHLKSRIVLTSYSLYINDVLKSKIGKVGTSAKDSDGSYKTSYVDFNPKTQEIELIYQTSDFTQGDCAIAPPELGLSQSMNEASRMSLGRDLLLFGMLLIMGIYHLGLFAMRVKDLAPLYFSLFCLSFATRMLFVGERFIYSLLNVPLMLLSRVCYSCAYGGVCALYIFIYHAVDGLFPKWYLKLNQVLGVVSVAMALLTPYAVFEGYLMFFSAVIFMLLLYTIVKLFIGTRDRVEFAGLVLGGTLFLGAALINDLIYQYTLTNRASMIPVGVFVFTLTQSLTLSSKFSKAFAMSEKLTAENEMIMADLKDVNANLENRVSERTKDLQVAIKELDRMSKTDYLTKLPNRRLIFEKMDALVTEGRTFYIALADIDKFKLVNDTYGHDCGDKILIAISEALSQTLGEAGFVGRWGGEEFLIVLLTDERSVAEDIAEKLCARIRNLSYHHLHYPQIHTTVTMGLYPYIGLQSLDMCIACADEALYRGKEGGRNQFVMYQVEEAE